jgi:DNA-directed RNA polymerase subunit RPC12/RpoP
VRTESTLTVEMRTKPRPDVGQTRGYKCVPTARKQKPLNEVDKQIQCPSKILLPHCRSRIIGRPRKSKQFSRSTGNIAAATLPNYEAELQAKNVQPHC